MANATAPYESGLVGAALGKQIASPALWSDSIRYLLSLRPTDFHETGTSFLSKMVKEIQAANSGKRAVDANPATPADIEIKDRHLPSRSLGIDESAASCGGLITARSLGHPSFRNRFNARFAYAAGAMYRAVASSELVICLGKAGLLGFFGTGGLSLRDIEAAIHTIQARLPKQAPYGMNLLANYGNPAVETGIVELFLRHQVRAVEASAFVQMTPALVRYRIKGLRKNAEGATVCENNILAKVSRPEIAELFMSPPPADIVQQLFDDGLISDTERELAKTVPMSYDLCIEADSGGHTDARNPSVLFPAMLQLKNRISATHAYDEPICMGLAGGIGTPEAAAAAFVMGADFILTGSINQCTFEAGISEIVKDLLQDINVQDTEYAPAGDMFESGAKVQVLQKGVFFPARANKLFSLYKNYDSLDEIPEKIQKQIQQIFFKKSFAEVWNETRAFLENRGQGQEIVKAETNKKHKMALIFRWYFAYSSRLTFDRNAGDKVNYQVHTGPALGAFNQWVKGTELEDWRQRHVDVIGIKLLTESAAFLNQSFARLGASAERQA